MKAVNIICNSNFEEEVEMLPKEIEIPDGMDEDDIEDYISNITDHCCESYELRK